MADFTIFEVHLHDGFSFSPTNTAPMFSGEQNGEQEDATETVEPAKGRVSKLLGRGGSKTEADSDDDTDNGVDRIETAADTADTDDANDAGVEVNTADEVDESTKSESDESVDDESSGGNGGKLLIALVLVVVIAAVARNLMGGDEAFDNLEELDELSDEA
jgi:hypothetical protein